MKCCSRCKTDKPIADFYRLAGKLHSWCKTCFNLYTTERWKERKVAVIKRMGGECVDCGIKHRGGRTGNTVIFDLHHTTGTADKQGDWKKMRQFSDDRLDKELAKCVLLCANCHRMRHRKIVPR